jgi:hypothetical protein
MKPEILDKLESEHVLCAHTDRRRRSQSFPWPGQPSPAAICSDCGARLEQLSTKEMTQTIFFGHDKKTVEYGSQPACEIKVDTSGPAVFKTFLELMPKERRDALGPIAILPSDSGMVNSGTVRAFADLLFPSTP